MTGSRAGRQAPMPPRRHRAFMICGLARSGTSVIGESLEAAQGIEYYSEVLSTSAPNDEFTAEESFANRQRDAPLSLISKLRFITSRVNYLDRLLLDSPQDSAAVGFKLMYNQLAGNRYGNALLYRLPWSARALCADAFPQWAATNDVHVILVTRMNVLETLVSMKRAERDKVFHSTGTTQVPREPVTIPTRSLIFRLHQLAEAQEHIEVLFRDCVTLSVTYEEDWHRKMQRIADFLSVPGLQDAPPALKKVGAARMQSAIANFDSVVDRLKGTKFEWMASF